VSTFSGEVHSRQQVDRLWKDSGGEQTENFIEEIEKIKREMEETEMLDREDDELSE